MVPCCIPLKMHRTLQCTAFCNLINNGVCSSEKNPRLLFSTASNVVRIKVLEWMIYDQD